MKTAYLLTIVITAWIAMFVVKKKHVAIPFACALPLLPGSVSIIMGSVNMWGTDLLSAGAVLIIVLRGGLKPPFRFTWGDLLLPAACLWWGLGRFAQQEGTPADIFQATVRWFSPWALPYFAARMGIQSWESVRALLKALFGMAIFITGLTLYEAITGQNVLIKAGIIGGLPKHEQKFGIWRSYATMNSIHNLGMYLAFLTTISVGFFFSGYGNKATWGIVGPTIAAGCFCTTASSGVVQGVMAMGFFALYPFRQYWKVWTTAFFAWVLFVEIYSNRHFYHVAASMMQWMGEAYYRAMLIDQMLDKMPGHWWFGYGFEMVTLRHVRYEDICNQWLFFLVKAGAPSFLFLLGFYVFMSLRLRDAYELVSSYEGERIILWAFASFVVSLSISWFFNALFGSAITPFSFIFGVIVSLPDLARYAMFGAVTQETKSVAPWGVQSPAQAF